MISIEKQIEARRKLVMSARQARMQGFTREEWKNAQVVKEFTLNCELPNDIVEHISAFVWTFSR